MIRLSRLHGNGSIVVNADLIETIEACPDTTIMLTTKRRFVVVESVNDVIDRIIEYRKLHAITPVWERRGPHAAANSPDHGLRGVA